MPGAREIGMMGAALALTGGVACAFCYLMHQTQKPKKKVKDELNEHAHKATKTETARKTPIISEVCWFRSSSSSWTCIYCGVFVAREASM